MNSATNSLGSVAAGVGLAAITIVALLILIFDRRRARVLSNKVREQRAQLNERVEASRAVEHGRVTLVGRIRAGTPGGVALRIRVRLLAKDEVPGLLGYTVRWREESRDVVGAPFELILHGSGERVTVVPGDDVLLHASLSRRLVAKGTRVAERVATLCDGDPVWVEGTIGPQDKGQEGADGGYPEPSPPAARIIRGKSDEPLTIFTRGAFRLVSLHRRQDAMALITDRLAYFFTLLALLSMAAMAWGGVEVEASVTSVRGTLGRKLIDVQAISGLVRCAELTGDDAAREGARVLLRYVPWWPSQCALAGPFRFYTGLNVLLVAAAVTAQVSAVIAHVLGIGLQRPPEGPMPYAHRWGEGRVEEDERRFSPLG